MSDDFEQFLRRGPEIVKQNDERLAAERDKERKAQEQAKDKRDALLAQWVQTKHALDVMVIQINEAFKGVNVDLKADVDEKQTSDVATVFISLNRNGVFTGRTLTLTVDDLGQQKVTMPFGSSLDDFILPHINHCGAYQYAQMLQAFMEPELPNL